MRDTVAGSVLAIIFLALLFAAPKLLPHGIEATTQAEIAQIPKGFIGTRFIGAWVLVCSRPAASNQKPQAPIGPCRMARAYRDNNGRLILTLAFRYAGTPKVLTMIVRFPPIGRKGQFLLLVLGKQTTLKLPVFDCAKDSCVAVGAMVPAATSLLVSSPQARVVLPPTPEGKQYTIRIQLDGLPAALTGMQRAEL
ncbi:MAG TPA: invasion associated locus B family protein [Rhizomicrobium sp.]|jgi:invasion protein IalB|nr:invasion associated locus B family protein [Rhizomicrobium sp.]